MKIIIIGIVFFISKCIIGTYEYGEEKWPITTVTLNSTMCLNSGKILYGLVKTSENISSITVEIINGICPNDSILLEPGVFINDFMVGSNGTCLMSGELVVGKAVSIGPLIELDQNLTSDRLCSNLSSNVVLLSSGVILINLPSTTPPNEVLVVQNSPLLRNLNYTSIVLNETICLESGVVINALISPDYTTTKPKMYKSCAKGTIRIEPGVVVKQQSNTIMFTSVSCMSRGVIQAGRILIYSDSKTIPLGGSLCDYNETANITNGIIFLPGVTLLVSAATEIKQRVYEIYPKKNDIYSDSNNNSYNKTTSNRFDDIRKKYINMIKEIDRFKNAYMSYMNEPNHSGGGKDTDGKDKELNEMWDDMQLYVNDGIGKVNIDNLEADIDIDVDFD